MKPLFDVDEIGFIFLVGEISADGAIARSEYGPESDG